MKGKPWTVEEERLLRDLAGKGKSLTVMASAFGKTPESVKQKLRRLGLKREVVVQQNVHTTTSNGAGASGELPNLKRTLGFLSEALELLRVPGLDQAETLRLRTVVQAVKTYKELLADYLDFCGLETRLFELEAKYAELTKGKASGS